MEIYMDYRYGAIKYIITTIIINDTLAIGKFNK